jgi:hypothetical protein
MTLQDGDHWRFRLQPHRRLQPCTAESLASLGDANKLTDVEMPTYLRQHLERLADLLCFTSLQPMVS